MLNEAGADYEYREYTSDPLTKTEIKKVLGLLGMNAKDMLRKNDKAYKELGLTGTESNTKLIGLMAEHPTLLQRPIAIAGKKAVVGRPPENVLQLV